MTYAIKRRRGCDGENIHKDNPSASDTLGSSPCTGEPGRFSLKASFFFAKNTLQTENFSVYY